LKPEKWGSLLVQEQKYLQEEACDKRQKKIIIMIIIKNENVNHTTLHFPQTREI